MTPMRRLVAWTISGTAVTLCVTGGLALAGTTATSCPTIGLEPLWGAAGGMLWLGSSMSATTLPVSADASSRGSRRFIDRRIQTFFFAALAILTVIGAVAFASIELLRERTQWAEHSYVVRVQLEQLVEQYHEARLGWRSYLFGELEDDRLAFEAAQSRVPRLLSGLIDLTRDNPSQQDRLQRMSGYIALDLAAYAADVDARRGGALAAGDVRAHSAAARFHARELDDLTHAFREEETTLLANRVNDARDSAHVVVLIIVAGNLAGFATLLFAFRLLRRENGLRAGLQSALEAANAELESRIAQRTRALAEANRRLTDLNSTLEERIAARASEFEDLYNHSPCGYHSVDGDGVFLQMNDTELEWLGYTRQEVIGRMRHHDLHTPDSLARYVVAFAELKRTGILRDAEFEYVRKDGTILDVSVSATAVADAHGGFVHSRSSVNDITAKKRAEREILALNASLEARARDLQTSNEELESFSYSVSHDLRTPLRAIDGFARMLDEDNGAELDAEGRRLLGVVRANSQRMGALIDDLLALSRIGRQRLASADVAMAPLVQEVIAEALLVPGTSAPRIDVGPLPDAQCDRALVRQVWANLIANAIKYSSRTAEPRIRVTGVRDGQWATYRVEDNGTGFEMQYAHKLFGVFQRLHRADEFPGTGVGLAIVRRIVARHGGEVGAEGRLGEGATFTFTLPCGGRA